MPKDEIIDDDFEIDDEYDYEEPLSLFARKERVNKKMMYKKKLEEFLEERALEKELSSW
ncbi:MAG: hypothetical protein OEY78_13025 [Gammaproteobacteria bacterium]|nr:hypothetical protein [Gammaproteobacteria bacterium]